MRRLRAATLVAAILVAATLVAATVAFAVASTATLTLTESGGNTYGVTAWTVLVNNSNLVTQGFMTSTGLDARVLEAATQLPRMVASDRTTFATATLVADTVKNLTYSLGNTPTDTFYIIPGYNGYITVADNNAIEFGDAFTFDEKCYADMSAGTNKDAVYKQNAFRVYVQAAGAWRAAILGSGDSETKAVTVTGISSAIVRIRVVADGTTMTLYVYDASGTSLGSDSIAMSGASVPDNSNVWYLNRNNATPYIEYVKFYP